uniref:Putative endonuclease-reverse transcriptase n=1 Tax=Panstrongylus lignarius TaxID=156445 RepID=A0A224XQI4_9HEMI
MINFLLMDLRWIFKARCDLLRLNSISFDENRRNCCLCNMFLIEDNIHFLAMCPIYNEIRTQYFNTNLLTKCMLIDCLNGANWKNLVNYCKQPGTTEIYYREVSI